MTHQRNWIVTASADHVRIGRELGIMQVCHGKAAPLRRIASGDRIAYYSPRSAMRGGDSVKAFTALGIVADDAIYQVEMAPGFCPFRRRVAYLDGTAAPILPLLDALDFTRGKRNWGYAFRWGLFEVSDASIAVIAAAMRIERWRDAPWSPPAREEPALRADGVHRIAPVDRSEHRPIGNREPSRDDLRSPGL